MISFDIIMTYSDGYYNLRSVILILTVEHLEDVKLDANDSDNDSSSRC